MEENISLMDELLSIEYNERLPDQISEIGIDQIKEFDHHPFKVLIDDDMHSLSESIKEYGVLSPIIVRKKGTNYEIVSGHRRKKACELIGKQSIPCIIKELTDDEATILMVDSNMQREKILPSEKGFAYRMKLEAIKHQGYRNDLTSVQVAQKSQPQTSRAKLGKEVGESQDQVRRYIRLTYLIEEILKMVDEEQIALNPAVALSYLKKDEQLVLLNEMNFLEATPSLSQAIRLKKLSASGMLNEEKIRLIMSEIKPNQTPSLRVSGSKLKNLLPTNLKNDREKETYIIRAVEFYGKYLKQKRAKVNER